MPASRHYPGQVRWSGWFLGRYPLLQPRVMSPFDACPQAPPRRVAAAALLSSRSSRRG